MEKEPNNNNNRIVFMAESLCRTDDTSLIHLKKVSWLADHSPYEVYLLLTEPPKEPPTIELSPKVKVINLNVNYDRLKGANLLTRTVVGGIKYCLHGMRLNKALCKIRPMATVSAMGKELLLLSRIKDGSQRVYEVHYDKHSRIRFPSNWFSKKVCEWSEKFHLSCLSAMIDSRDILVADTENLRQVWVQKFKNVLMVPNPLKELPCLREFEEPQKVMALVGYSPHKGCGHLIDIWESIVQRHPDWKLHIYGDGDPTKCVEMIKSKHLVKSVQCFECPENLSDTYRDYSFLIQVCEFDAYGKRLMEAMSHTLPCVAYDVPYGADEIIHEEWNGFLVSPNHLLDLSSKVEILVGNSELRYMMGTLAHEHVQRFEINIVMRQWLNLFDSIKVGLPAEIIMYDL